MCIRDRLHARTFCTISKAKIRWSRICIEYITSDIVDKIIVTTFRLLTICARLQVSYKIKNEGFTLKLILTGNKVFYNNYVLTFLTDASIILGIIVCIGLNMGSSSSTEIVHTHRLVCVLVSMCMCVYMYMYAVSYTHLDVYKRQVQYCLYLYSFCINISF